MRSLRDEIAAKYALVRREEEDLHGYQEDAYEFLDKNPFSALFIDTGLGKTVICLTLIARLLELFAFNRVLIIAPIRVAAQTWPNEIPIWRHTAHLNWSVIRAEDDDEEVISAGKAAYQEARWWAADDKEARSAQSRARTAKKEELRKRRAASPASVHVIDREHTQWIVDQYSEFKVKRVKTKEGRIVEKRVRTKIVDWPYDVVIIDESSSFKDHTTSRFKALLAVRKHLARMHQLTATPASESYLHLFPQIFLLDRGKRLGNSVTAYRERFFNHNEYRRTYTLKDGAEQEISALISDICLVMKSEDYLDEQPPLFPARRISLDPAQEAIYRKFEKEFILELPDGEIIEAETTASLAQKLMQLASGAIYRADGSYHVFHDHKIEDLRQLVEELDGSPLFVSYWFQSTRDRLKKAFPQIQFMDKAGKMVHPWNEGKIPILAAHPASVGHGLNMQYGPGHDVYNFDAYWSYELFYQFYRRIHRQGQTKRVRVHNPRVLRTRDELVFDGLEDKRDMQEVLFNEIKARRRQLARARLAA